LTCEPLPALESDFFNLLSIWFPCIYDIKHVVRSVKTLRGGLQEIAESLGVQRIGPQHQAGSDSLLTAAVFFRIRGTYFENKLDDDYYRYVSFHPYPFRFAELTCFIRGYLYGFSSGQNRVRYAIDGLNPGRAATSSPASGMAIFGAEKPY
jgi:CCR4-NOT transcription complex subunit 7/8